MRDFPSRAKVPQQVFVHTQAISPCSLNPKADYVPRLSFHVEDLLDAGFESDVVKDSFVQRVSCESLNA